MDNSFLLFIARVLFTQLWWERQVKDGRQREEGEGGGGGEREREGGGREGWKIGGGGGEKDCQKRG